MTKPCIVAVSGVSGTGKTTLISNLEKVFPGCRVTTYTTRPMRPTESPSAYNFCTVREMESLTDTLWVKENYGHFYAVTRSSFLAPIKACGIALLPTITPHHETLRAQLTDVRHVGIHLLSPPRSELEKRMHSRGESSTVIEDRLKQIERINNKALSNPLLHCLKPGFADSILQTVLAVIQAQH